MSFQRSVVAVATAPRWGVSGRSVRDSSGPCMQTHCTGNSFLSILCISRGSQHDGTSFPIWLSTPSASPFSLLTPFKYVKGGNSKGVYVEFHCLAVSRIVGRVGGARAYDICRRKNAFRCDRKHRVSAALEGRNTNKRRV